MTIKEIFEHFNKIGCCTFATIDGEYPETRIAHFLVYDDEGGNCYINCPAEAIIHKGN